MSATSTESMGGDRTASNTRRKISVHVENDGLPLSEEDSLNRTAETSLRERSMNSDNDYPGVNR